MKKMSTFAKKLCAAVLSAVLIVGAMPATVALDDSKDSSGGTNNVSTPDEPAGEPGSQSDNPVVDPSFSFNEGANACYTDSEELCFTKESLKFVLATVQPDSAIYSIIESDFTNTEIGFVNAKVYLEYQGDDLNHTPDCQFEAKNGIVTAQLDFTPTTYPTGLPAGDFVFKFKYSIDGNEVELFSRPFHVVDKAPEISNLKYGGETTPKWSKSDVNITFDVDSDIIYSVTVNDKAATKSNKSYTYTADKSGKYTVVVKDRLGQETTKETPNILIDKKEPSISAPKFYDGDKEVSGWHNHPAIVKMTLSDADSGVDKDTVKVTGAKDVNIEESEGKIAVSFLADEIKDYQIECKDKAGNTAMYTLKKDNILLDTKAPAANDFTLSFSAAENAGDKILNFLSFGLYANQDLHVLVNVSNAEQSDIDVDTIKLYNGKDSEQPLNKVGSEGTVFLLKAPENDGEKVDYDLYVEATDKAGNASGRISLTEANVKTKLPDGTESVQNFDADLFEVVISKIVPDFGTDGISFNFEKKVENNSEVYVAGNGTVSVKVSEPVSGIKAVTALLDNKEATVSLSADVGASKVTELTASFAAENLTDGEHEVAFVATANSGMTETIKQTFTADNTAPVLDGDFTVPLANNTWSNSNVNVTFKLSDKVDVKSVKYYNSTEKTEPAESDLKDALLEDDVYTIIAESYGDYTVLVEDDLGNRSSIKTESPIRVDKASPEVVDEAFTFNSEFTNKPVKVSFKVKDNPENCSGIDTVTVDGKPALKNGDENDTYHFEADHYGSYEVKVSDKAGNYSKTYIVGTVKFDDIKPVVKQIAFSAVKNATDYGLYGNEVLTVTATVENRMNDANDGAALKKVELRDGDKVLSSDFKHLQDNLYTLSYTITPDTKPTDLSVYVEDEAGNNTKNSINDSGVEIFVDNSAVNNTKLSEIVITEQTPSLDALLPNFTRQQLVNGQNIYSGSGEFTTAINDSLSGIDSYSVYFVKTSDVVFSENNITNLDSLTPQEKVEDISKYSKQNSKSVKIKARVSDEDSILPSGEYTAIIKADNLSGNSIVEYKNVIVDNTAPVITEVRIKTRGISETINANGIYTSQPINVEVSYDDGSFSAGISKIELFNGDNDAARISGSDDGRFTVSEDGQYFLYGLVTDAFGNKLDKKENLSTKKLFINGSEVMVNPESFEIVISNSPEETTTDGINYQFRYNNSARVFKEDISEDGIITATLKNELIGLKSTDASLTNMTTNQKENVKITKFDEVTDGFGKLTAETLSVDSAGLPSGAYEVEFSAQTMGGVKKSFTETFFIDKTAPVIESVTYEKTSETADKLLNLLTFGLYSNENILVKVRATDAAPSAGIIAKDITLSSETGLKITEGELETVSEGGAEQVGEYVKSFTLGVSSVDADSFYSDLKASVTDIYMNGTGGGFREFKNYANEESFQPGEDFEIVSSTIAPVVSDVELSDESRYEKDGEIWFSKGPKLTFTTTDNNSKLHAVKVTLNGADVTNQCTYDAGSRKGILPAEFTSFEAGLSNPEFTIPVNKIETAFETADSSDLKEGENVLVITATGNNGVSTNEEDYTYKFFVDYSAPEVKEGSISFERNADKVWTKDNVRVSFTVQDLSGVGVKSVEIYRDGEKLDETQCQYSWNEESGECSFIADQYGEYSAKVTDIGENTSTKILGTVLIDKSAPIISKVEFAAGEGTFTQKEYGIYGNGTIKLTVTVSNDKAGFAACAPLGDDAVTVSSKNSEAENYINFISRNESTNEFTFEIHAIEGKLTADDFDLKFKVEDLAGMSSESQLSDKGIPVTVDASLEQYEVIATLNKPEISPIDVSFTNDAKNEKGETILLKNSDGIPVHSGDGTFTATITDQLANIDKFKTYFVKTSDLKFDSKKEITNLDKLTPATSEEGISDSEKVKSKTVQFKSSDLNALASGSYTAVVEAYNLSGNHLVTSTQFIVDNTEPKVTGVSIRTSGKADTVTDNGIFTSKPITLTIQCSDGDYSAGIAQYELFNGTESLGSNTSGIFSIAADGIYQFRALVTDKFGNKLNESEDLKAVPIIVTGTQGEKTLGDSHKENFEIVINSSLSDTKFSDFSNDFHYHTDTNIYKNLDKDGNFSIVAANEKSGIKSNSVSIKNKETDEVVVDTCQIQDEVFASTNPKKKIKNTIVANASALSSGSYEITFTVTDLGGVEDSFTDVFYIDKTPSTIESIRYEAAETAVDKLLNLLTFGIYSNTNIKAVVTVSDASPASGISAGGVKLTSETGLSITDAEFSVLTESSPTVKGRYEKAFILGVSAEEAKSYYNDLAVEVTDNFDNHSGNNFRNFKNYANDSEFEPDDTFEILSSTIAPVVSNVAFEGQNRYEKGEETSLWFSKGPKLSFTASDSNSKIHSVKITLNGTDVTGFGTYTAENYNGDLPAEFTKFSNDIVDPKFSKSISEVTVELDTTKSSALKEGENTVIITVTGNNGVSTENSNYTYKFFTDYTAPVITDGSVKFENNANKEWTNQDVKVDFTANDGNGVGLDKLEIYRYDTKLDDKACAVAIDTETGACSFTASEYGEYSAKLTDLNGNSETYALGAILIDKSAPTVVNVKFEPVGGGTYKAMPYGVYSNSPIRMTVTVNNDAEGYDDNAPLSDSAVTVTSKVSIEKKNITFKERTENTNNFVFEINPVSGEFNPDDFDLSFTVEDTAKNKSAAQLDDAGVSVSVDSSLEQFEVIATLNKPTISDITVSFTNEKLDDKNKPLTNKEGLPVYSGTGTFTATITDKLANIDSYKTYFVRTKNLKFDEKTKQITNLSLFAPISSETNISKDSKVKVIEDVTFKTSGDVMESDDYTAIVEAYNLSGNSFVTYTSFVVDNDPPKVTGMEITSSSGNDTITDNGVYTSGSLTVKVKAEDGDLSAGIAQYELFNGTKSLGSNSNGSFTIDDDGTYNLRALVVDKFGYHEDKPKDLKSTHITVKDSSGKYIDLGDSHKENFEIVINNNSDEIEFSDFSNDFHYHTTDTNIYKNFDKDGNFSIVAENEMSGIKSNSVSIKNKETDKVVVDTCQIQDVETAKNNPKKTTQNTIVANASNLPTGSYEITFTVTDLGGVANAYTYGFYIDKTEPQVESIKYEPAATAFDKLLNLLSFGLYANTDVRATVTVTDAAPSSGISTGGIKLTSETVLNIKDAEFSVVTESSSTVKGRYEKAFILGVGKDVDDSFYNDLQVSVKDNFDNGTDGAFQQYNNLYSDGKMISNVDGNFDIVVTSKTPDIMVTDVTGANKFTDSHGKIWFSGQPTVDFDVTDNVSKIHSVEVKLNKDEDEDRDVTAFTTFDVESLPSGVFTDFKNHSGNKYSSVHGSIDTSNENVSKLVVEGVNKISIFATGNNGNRTESPTEQVFYYDTTKPVVQNFEFKGDGYSDAESGDPGAKNYEKTDYGYFFKNTTNVTVTANDGEGSGVKGINFKAVDVDGNVVVDETQEISGTTATFTVNAGFKGSITAYAYDHVLNNKDGGLWFNPENAVVETEAQHAAATSVDFSLPETSFRDNGNLKLYPNKINLSFTAVSSYAGIREVQYSVISDYDKGNDYTKSIVIGHDGSISEQVDSSERYIDNKGNTTNLVTKLTKTISINNESNNIHVLVKVIDRAGWSSEKESEKFSIDTVEPRIVVDWSPSEGNQVANGDFYKVDRTATITVTERNFNPDDFKLIITNTDGSIPALVPGEGWSTSYGFASNPDATIHKATIVFHNDGDYNMETSYTDLAGHASPDNGKKEKEFTIDQTIPKISISFDKNNSNDYYNETRTATIRIEEHNFIDDPQYLRVNVSATGADNSTSATPPSVSAWQSAGTDAYQATIVFNGDKQHDGKFSFTVDFKDKATNEATQARATEFYVDTKIDTIEIVNVEDLTAYDDTIAPQINYFDYNFAEGTYSLRRIDYGKDPENASNLVPTESSGSGFSKIVSYSDFAKVEENDGIYLLNAHIKDKAGNEDNKDVLFSVNRFGSTFMIQDETTNELINDLYYTNNAPDVVITEINVNEISDPIVQVNRDDSTRNLEKGSDYQITQNSGSRQSWFAYDYRILKKNFELEGNYVVTVTSTDKFKKVVSNRTAYKETDETKEQIDRTCPVSFVVDKTKPVVTITGVSSGEYYEEAAKNVIVNCDDANITSEFLKVEFDGKELKRDADYTISSETNGNVEVRLELEADGKDIDRDLKVTISDKANNFNDLTEGGEVSGFRLSASWLARLLHYNLPIVIVAGGVVLAGIALAVFLIVKKRSKKEN